VSTGSHLLGKFTRKFYEYFNCKVYISVYRVRDMEHKYKLTNPKDITSEPNQVRLLLEL